MPHLHRSLILVVLSLLVVDGSIASQAEGKDSSPVASDSFSGLALRGIGPATMSGRISDIAVDAAHPDTWYLGVASGGVWKTTNAGTTWSPIFDGQGSYSTGVVVIDPNNPLTVWVGTGENNSQRSVSYGDGVYKSIDGGKTWKNVGLEKSEHIGKILIDPRDSDTVYVAAQGPLWAAGGDRGLYKTTDGGQTWNKALDISENTGVNEVVCDPRNPDILLASSYQRRRHVWTLVDGGPESAIYRSADAGATWTKVDNGLPKVQLGRMGLAVAPSQPDTVYAIVEAQEGKSGLFRSIDGGINWEKRSDYVSSSPQYYNELVVDPMNPDRVYAMDTFLHRSDDGGKTWYRYPERTKHVDNHALWIDPANTLHLLAGCDGGFYESRDRGETWDFFANLPVTQFYTATPDNDFPFYNVYGGTQDNATQGGPSRTRNRRGIVNSDWYVTVFGDGFKTRVDPENPDILYSQSQYGNLVRYDRKSGEAIDVQPQPAPGDAPLRWNWNSPLIISPHSHTRLYFAAQRIFRSDDRGDSWTPVSPDLSRDLDRNKLDVMGRVWSVDAVAKNASTSFYGSIVTLSESPLVDGLIYAGTDDGLIQVTENGGQSWRKIDSFPGISQFAYVSRVQASLHDSDTVYASFDIHKMGDFKPYILKSTDRGRSWSSITGDLPERGSVYAIVQDHEKKDLLFAGTEFGLFFTVDEGKSWKQLKGGIPVIAIRDLEIQRRENDLVAGSFGRGFFILDDYSPLRLVNDEVLSREVTLFPVRKAWMYIEEQDFDTRFQGNAFFAAKNPPFGAVFTYYLKDGLETLRKQRQEAEKKEVEENKPVAYPTWDRLREEDREQTPAIVLTVTDLDGQVVQRIEGPTDSGFHRVAWNLRYPSSRPVRLNRGETAPWSSEPVGPLAMPGRYTVTISKRVNGQESRIAGPETFEAVALGQASLPSGDRSELLTFQKQVARLQRALLGSERALSNGLERIRFIDKALDETPEADSTLRQRVRNLQERMLDLQVRLSGDSTVASRNEPTMPSISDRVERIVDSQWSSTSAPTETNRQAYQLASQLFEPVLDQLRQLLETDLAEIDRQLEEIGAPWTPGRVPAWSPE